MGRALVGMGVSPRVADLLRSGRLNISSRELSKIPALVFEELASSTSKPSDELDLSLSRLAFDFDLSIPDHDPGRRWYDARVELVCVNASNNELSSLPDSIGGLEYLQILDVSLDSLRPCLLSPNVGKSCTTIAFTAPPSPRPSALSPHLPL